MTEYDYSPEAYEQHLAKQARIARWVDNTHAYTPANPFHPLPEVSDDPAPASQANLSQPPTTNYSIYSNGSARRRPPHRSHTNPQPSALGLPIGAGFYMGATQAQLAQPMSPPGMAMTMTSPSPQNQWIPYRSPTFLPFGSPTQFSGYPYSQPYQSPSGSSSHSPYHPNNAYTPHPYSSSSVQSLPLSTPSGTTIQNSNPNQPVVVPLNGGGFVVLPPGQHVQVISAKDYFDAEKIRETDSADFSAQSFFGNLRMGRKKVKGSSRERRSASATAS